MDKNNKTLYMVIIIIVILLNLFFFYENFINSNQEKNENGLVISDTWSSKGSVSDKNLDQTEITYGISLKNEYIKDKYIVSVEVVLNESVSDLYESGALVVPIEEVILPDHSISVETNFIFNTKDMSKMDIEALEPIIKEVIINSQETISFID